MSTSNAGGLIPRICSLKINGNYVSLEQQHAVKIHAFSTSHRPIMADIPNDICAILRDQWVMFYNDRCPFQKYFLPLDNEPFVTRTYGSCRNKKPSELEDFMPQNNESIISDDFVEYEFADELFPLKISIYETLNPGSIIKIWAYDGQSRWKKLWSGNAEKCTEKFRIFCPPLPVCRFKTKRIRLEINHRLLDYHAVIRGISLIGTKELIVPKIQQKNEFSSKLLAILNLDNPHNGKGLISPRHPRIAFKESFAGDLEKLKYVLRKNYISGRSQVTDESEIKSMDQNEMEASIDVSIDDTRDNFAILDIDTIHKILKYLDLQTLWRCSELNKRFYDITRDPLLYKSLNFKPYWNCINSSALNAFAMCSQHLQRLDLSWCFSYQTETSSFNSTEAIHNLFQVCKNTLTHLRLNCCNRVDDKVVERISSMKNLQELCLDHCRKISRSGFECLEKLESLTRLNLYFTHIDTTALCSIIKKNPQLRHLDVGESMDYLQMDRVAIVLADCCPNLESINCWRSGTFTQAGVKSLSRCTQLRECDFGWCVKLHRGETIPSGEFRNLFASCRLLEKIDLTAQVILHDTDLEPLLSSKRIKQLHFAGGTCTSLEIYEHLLSQCPQLRVIDISLHMGINDEHIAMWRQVYPHVSIIWRRNVPA